MKRSNTRTTWHQGVPVWLLSVALATSLFAVATHAGAQSSATPSRAEVVLGTSVPLNIEYDNDRAGPDPLEPTSPTRARIPGVPVRQHPLNTGLFDTGCAQCHRLSGPLPEGTDAPPDVFDRLAVEGTEAPPPDGFARLTNAETREEYPTWSPDGEHILYEVAENGRYDLWLMNADGNEARQVTDHDTAGWATWHPSGGSFAYWASGDAGTSNLWLHDVRTGRNTRLTDHTMTAWPQWSPDGERLAYQAQIDDAWTLRLMDPDNGLDRALTDPTERLPSRPLWSPDGTELLYQSLAADGFELRRLVFATDQEGTPDYDATPRRVYVPTDYPIDLGAATQRPAWHPAGDRIALVTYALDTIPVAGLVFNYKTWTMTPTGTYPRQLLPEETIADRSPTWRPDGTWIAQWSWNRDFTASVWLIREDATARVELTKDLGGDALYPAWSPDGTRIAFASNRAGTFDIWVADVEDVIKDADGIREH